MRRLRFAYGRQFGAMVVVLALLVTGGLIRNVQAKTEYISVKKEPLTEYIRKNGQVNKPNKTVPERPDYQIDLESKYQDLIWQLCLKNNFSYELVLAVFKNESGFRINAKNKNTDGSWDQGVGQINSYYEDNYKNCAVTYGGLPTNVEFDVWNPEHNIRGAVGGLVHLRNIWRDAGVSEDELVYFLLGSYNRGVNGFKTYTKKNNTIHTAYADKVMQYKNKLEQSKQFD